jgi:hypothetical protein
MVYVPGSRPDSRYSRFSVAWERRRNQEFAMERMADSLAARVESDYLISLMLFAHLMLEMNVVYGTE